MGELQIVSRAEWGARGPKSRKTIGTPTRELWLHHSAASEKGPAGVRRIQAYHMDSRGYADIAYSFVVDRTDLTVYEGRGAGIQGGHTFGRNSVSHGICVMGNFEPHAPKDSHPDLIARLGQLVAHGHANGWWPAQLSGGHREVKATACPGDWLNDRVPMINAAAAGGAQVDSGQGASGMPPTSGGNLVLRLQKGVNSVGANPPLDEDGKLGEKTVTAIEDLIRSRSSAIAQLEEVATLRDTYLDERDEARGEATSLMRQVAELEAELADLDGDTIPTDPGGPRPVDPDVAERLALADSLIDGFRRLVDLSEV